jgi:hypothetical protein
MIFIYPDLGLVPKGGEAYFFEKRLGHGRACEILLSNKTIQAHEALELCLPLPYFIDHKGGGVVIRFQVSGFGWRRLFPGFEAIVAL